MKLGLTIGNFTMPGGPAALGRRLAEIARTADEVGFTSLWVMDHYFQIRMIGPPELEMLEGYTTLGYLAAVTKRIRLGTAMTGVTYRHPGLLVKIVTTLDVLSGGRAWLGLGAAWNEAEHRGLGVPFPPLRERFERLEEALQIAHQMWANDRSPIRGRHYTLEDPLNSPQPLSRPHPPIMVGGGGEQKTLRLVAQYADACNLFPGPELAHKLEVLRAHCRAVGRNYDDIEKTGMAMFRATADGAGKSVTPAQIVDALGEQARLGIQHVIVGLEDTWDLAQLELIGRDVLPQLAGM
jgi:F420-dependent oxidoreductase-like protein